MMNYRPYRWVSLFSQNHSLSFLFWLYHMACGIQFSDQGLNLGPLHCERRILATGPPGRFPPFRLDWPGTLSVLPPDSTRVMFNKSMWISKSSFYTDCWSTIKTQWWLFIFHPLLLRHYHWCREGVAWIPMLLASSCGPWFSHWIGWC